MSITALERVSADALALGPAERAELASLLLASLDDGPGDEDDIALNETIDRRIAEIEAGTVQLLTPAELDARIQARLEGV